MTARKHRIESLTPEQVARFPEFVERWTNIGLCTDPADRPAAEKAVAQAYRAAGLKPPSKIVWCGSPLSQGLTRAIVLDAGLARKIGDSVGASVWDSVGASVRDSVGASVGASVSASVRDSVRDSVYGQHDAGWLAFYEYFRAVTSLRAETKKLAGLTALARSAGWALPHTNICWISERHQQLARDARGRLHSVTGPACLYPDGWAIYAVNGVRVPAEWVEKRGELDPKTALTWQNIEQRRAAAELIGWKRVLECVNARTVDADTNPYIGTLLRADLPDAPNSAFLRVLCATGREFVLPVPRECETARAANAWTFSMKADEYELEFRT